MKHFTIKNVLHKTIIALSTVVIMTFVVPTRVSALPDFAEAGGTILKEIVQLLDLVGDVVMGGLNTFMLGADGFGSAMLDPQNDRNLQEGSGSWLVTGLKDTPDKRFKTGEADGTDGIEGIEDGYKVPNMLYSPENIFGNNIAALDVNFLRQNTFNSISSSSEAQEHSESAAAQLRNVIASWYKAFRNIAIVGLLSVLVYLGIRILISTASTDKAKYKESLKDWVVALCLVFVIHIIMSGILMLTDRVTELFTDSSNSLYTVQINNATEPGGERFNTNLTGLIRLQAQGQTWQQATAYAFIYLILVIYTVIFTIMYFKRFLWIAFLTMIAPLVALTYPLDKVGDSKAQAFRFWLKEYTMHVILQPVHLILYTVLVSAASDLVLKNPIYGIVAIGFLIPAEKFIRQMFGLDKANSTGDFGSAVTSLLALRGLNSIGKSFIGKGGSRSSKGSSGGSSEDSEQLDGGKDKINFAKTDRETLGSFSKNDETPSSRNTNTNSNYNNNSGILTGNENENGNRNALQGNENGQGQNGILLSDGARMNQEQEEARQRRQQQEQAAADAAQRQKDAQARRNLGTSPEVKKGYRKRIIGRAAKPVARKVWRSAGKTARAVARIAGRGLGATTGLVVGAAVGAATGDIGNVLQYGAVGAATGGGIGNSLGNAVAGVPNNVVQTVKKASDNIDTMENAINEEKYGYDYAREQERLKQNERARKQFLKDDKSREKYKDITANLEQKGYRGSLEDVMNMAADYKEAGVSDDMIENALAAEVELGDGKLEDGTTHQKMIDVASFATKNGYTKSDILNTKSRESLEDTIEANVGEKDRYEVGRNIAMLFGGTAKQTYENKTRFVKPKQAEQPQQQTSNAATTNAQRTTTTSRKPTTRGTTSSNGTTTRRGRKPKTNNEGPNNPNPNE